MIISTSANLAIYRAIPINRLAEEFSPISLTKPIKNHVEAQGMEAAHIRDSVAIIRYLHWLEENVDTQNITELSGSRKVGELRRYSKIYITKQQILSSSYPGILWYCNSVGV